MHPLRIACNALFLQPGRNRGTETYVTELLPRLAQFPELDLTVITSTSNYELLQQLLPGRCRMAPISGRRRVQRVLYEQTRLARFARRLDAEILFCPGYLSPIYSPVTTVVTIHDMQFTDIPELISPLQRLLYRLVLPLGARTAKKIITVSEFSKTRIIDVLRLGPEKIAVTLEAPKTLRSPLNRTPKKFLDRPYILSVSSGLPHKNTQRLVEAYSALPENAHDLVLVGAFSGRFKAALSPKVHIVDYVDDAELKDLYTGATLFVLPSLYEGFGLPALEAMQCGVPVLASTAGSIPEVCGDAALYFDPLSVSALSQGLNTLLHDERKRRSLVQLGYANVDRFSWDRCAEETKQVFLDLTDTISTRHA